MESQNVEPKVDKELNNLYLWHIVNIISLNTDCCAPKPGIKK